MDEDQWIYDNIMSEEVNMNEDNGEELDVFENIDYSDAFNTSQVFATRDDILHWARSVAYDIGFMAVIMRKCGCPFKLQVLKGDGWMVKLICGSHNHALAKSLVGHPYTGRLTKVDKTIGDMTKSVVQLSYINFIQGQLFVNMWTFADQIEILNTHRRVIHKV
ncbi:uncharacterized protein LOC114404631 [Glycine soja]|uniref:uncharacterized protein LOC114404631 n=1 Tax=Glycine soja TaxID=3848 RepID=UPI00103A491F|nr:uncharacterized protein LOC114404631 [Glycine soja]